MQGLDELSSDAREYLHSRLIKDTDIIFLDVENYVKQGYLIKQVYLIDGGSSQRRLSMPLAISTPLAIIMLGILAIQYLSNSNKHHDPEEQDDSTTDAQVQIHDKLEDKIQVFFPEQIPFTETSINREEKLFTPLADEIRIIPK